MPAAAAAGGPGGLREALVRAIVATCLALLEWWLVSSPQATPKEIDEIFRTLAGPAIRAGGW